ncbi:SGNH/GDSL hydrolase family protein [Mucilaginibacter sp.]|jgi:lysophospholipase L1-like esterase|uniref:SGNH/GDSL hydrolase family protein n=1 Tax=Mucilaginibacter sp. TaxID=1882438 RepID=UPI003563FD72
MWLFNGADTAANLLNYKGSKNLVLEGTTDPVFNSKGILFNGENYADSTVKPSEFTDRKITLGLYNSVEPGTNYSAGIFTDVGFGAGRTGYLAFGGNTTANNPFQMAGLSTLNILSATQYTAFNRGVKLVTGVTGSGSDSAALNLNIWFGGINSPPNPTSFRAPTNNRVLFIADALTDAENVALNLSIEKYCLSLYSGSTQYFTFIGDSIVAGYGADTPYSGWSTQLCNNKLFTEVNKVVSGSETAYWVANPSLIPAHTSLDVGLMIALGTNDCDHNISLVTVKANMITILNNIITKGWPLDKIYVNLGYYDTHNSISKKDTYIAAIQEACTETLITNVFDMQAYMVDNGQDTLIQPDQLHPNQLGYDVIATGWINYID